MACPFFFPTQRCFSVAWSFPQRLPLGAGFCGTCRANAEETIPDDAALRDLCNLGHAGEACGRMPSERQADSVRFAIAGDTGDEILLDYLYDRDHTPIKHGRLYYNCSTQRWKAPLKDACVQRQAECYLATYLQRRRGSAASACSR